MRNAEQIYSHEYVHGAVRKDRALLLDLALELEQKIGRAGVEKMVAQYVDAYKGTINVKERNDGSFVYSFNAEKERRIATLRTLHAPVNNGISVEANNNSSNPTIPHQDVESQEDISDKKLSIVALQLM